MAAAQLQLSWMQHAIGPLAGSLCAGFAVGFSNPLKCMQALLIMESM